MDGIKTDLPARFAALGDPTRLAIVERLLKDGPQNAGALGDVAAISAPALSRHLKVLREAGLVERRVDRQHRIYSIRAEGLAEISAWSIEAQAFWSGNLDRLAALFAKRGTG
ncbi:metalloregulator ArsR/SmtB family transcription factor [Rhodobacterales bacterium HKCCE2091]|nr:metalloregulator ArsR/SmtB family transcription factor [Rhodobacterales bacterium HKCCE2091]